MIYRTPRVLLYTRGASAGAAGVGRGKNRMYIWEQIQFEWISSKLGMGNPGLPDPRVAAFPSRSLSPRLNPLLPLGRALVHALSLSFPHSWTDALSPPSRRFLSQQPSISERYFRRQIPPQQRKTLCSELGLVFFYRLVPLSFRVRKQNSACRGVVDRCTPLSSCSNLSGGFVLACIARVYRSASKVWSCSRRPRNPPHSVRRWKAVAGHNGQRGVTQRQQFVEMNWMSEPGH